MACMEGNPIDFPRVDHDCPDALPHSTYEGGQEMLAEVVLWQKRLSTILPA